MAQFKLGRIRFVWKGTWSTSYGYIVDDVIQYNGKTYICVVSHTSGTFSTDLANATPRWNLMTDGVSWSGDWAINTTYEPGTIVKYGGLVYICKTKHTSAASTALGLETNAAAWDTFATSFAWKGTWSATTRYKVNDLVKYGGYIFVCNLQHTSQSLLESDQSKWDTFNAGLDYKTTWASTTYYKTNDIVKYGADLWICTTAHTSTSTFDTSNFTIFVNGFQFESSWSNSTAYQVGDIVTYGGNAYVTLQNHTGQTPSTATSYWSVFTTGFNYRSDWSNSTAYRVGDVIRSGGYTYLAILDGTGQTPPNATYWTQLNSGLKWRTTTGTYSAVSASVLTGSGSGSPTFNVTRNNAVYSVTVASGGTTFAVGNTLKILGTAVGGASPVNDITVTVATISGSAIATVTSVGIAVTWTVTTAYVLGDVVLYGANSYVCISPHTASTGNRPDADTTGTYWNLLTAGAESAQLIATGDTFYYSSSGPSRLPIGQDGQVLRVSNSLPSWGYFGAVNNLVYVSPAGQDREDYGITPENPLKTIRYACKLVEDGYLNQNASSLLVRNKQFIIKEVNNFINYTYTYSIGATTISSDGTRPNQLTLATIATTSATADGSTATVGFTSQAVAPYAVGDTIVIAGVTPSVFVGTFTVTACTTTSVSFDLAQTAGPQTVAGTISRSTTALFLGLPVIFTASANGIVAGTTYYVKTIPDSRNFTVSATPSGSAITITATGAVTTSACYAYDATKTERDAGIALEAAIYDLSHGGTLNTTTAALAYYASASAYISGVYSYDIVPFVLALNYLTTLTGRVLSNIAPTNNYQALKAQATTANQILDTIKTAESGTSATVSGLISIITTGLTAGTTSAIPTAIQPNTTVSVKTGTYTEVLPIVVPRNTAIVGDELRSTVVQPKPAIALLANDKVHTVTALTRTQSLLSDLISNTTITPTSGNIQSQITTLPAGSAGSTAATTAVITRADLMVDVIKNGLTAVPAFTFTNPTGYNTSYLIGYGDGKAQVVQNYTFTKDDIGAYFTLNYSSLWTALGGTAQAQFKTDVSYILDALQHDMTYGGNVQTLIAGSSYYSNYVYVGTAQKAATLDAYGRLKTLISQIILKTGVVATSGNSTTWVTTGTAGSAGAATFAQARIQDIIDWITNGYAPASLLPTASIALASSALQASYTALQAKRTEIQSDTTAWVKKNYQSMPFNESTCYRDAGLIVDALAYDLVLGTNVNSITVGRSYLRATASAQYVIANQLAAELGSINFIMFKARQIAAAGAVAEATNLINDAIIGIRGVVTTTTVSVATSGTLVTVASTAGMYAGMKFVVGTTIGNIVANTWYWILTVPSTTTLTISATYGGSTFDPGTATATVSVTVGEAPETHGSITYNNTLGTIKGAEIIRANKNFLAYEATAYITASYGGTVTTTTASTDLFTLGSAHNLTAGDPVIFSGTNYAGSGITLGTTYYVIASGLTSTAFKVSTTTGGTAIDVTTNGSGSTLVVRYSFDAVSCRRDTLAFLDAFVYDLQYTGNYKTRRASTLYNNAVSGSLQSDMYYVRNGSGLRNMTVSGLTGALGSPNAYGTRRPTAGAYTSLDPGFGPNDTNVWINSRSCYTQNLTLFGFGCSGMKIDAALHAGGNRSIVANDYTTIISDGLGVWCTGSGALTELVSVFAYYSYAGYLAELGGRIRATNGNSSYGTYGVVAEGVDTFEVPISATVNNRYYEALVGSTITDGQNQILRVEYNNAGSAYTNASYAISGTGYNATAIGDEYRDSSVFETRLVDNNDGSATSVGGTSYVTISNSAQATTTVGQIKIANTDTALASAYAGMRVQITAGSGVGQYANILTYDNSSKIALIIKDSFVPITVTATTVTNGLLTVASTASLYVGMPIYLSGTMSGTGGASGLAANTLYYVISANFSATQFAVSTTSGGSAVTISNNVTALTVTLNAAGWDHCIQGYTSIVNSIDLTSAYIIEPRISYTSPGYTGTARTLSATATWTSAAYGAGKFVAVASGGTSASQSTDGKTWSSAGALSASTTWADVTYVGGEGATATAVVGGLGGSGAVLTAVLGSANGSGLPQADQVASVTVASGGIGYTTAPTIVFSGGSGSNATATCIVRNGAIVSVTVVTNGSSYVSAPTCTAATDRVTSVIINTAGKNYNAVTVPNITFTGGGASVQATALATVSNQGLGSIVLSTAGTGYTSVPNVSILDPNAKFIAIASTANNSATQTIAGLVGPSAWSAGTSTGKTDLAAIAYGNGIAVAVGGTSATGSVVSTSDFGGNWSDRSTTVNTANALSTGAYTSIAYGNGVFVAVNGGGGNKSSTSTNGTTTWTAGGTIPFTTAISIAYGNGRFVILGSDGKIAYSYDLGVTWAQSATCSGTTTSILSSTYTWTRIKYGQGLFVAISQGTVGATSEDGTNWIVRALPTSTNWKGLAFGNPSSVPTWVAVSNTSSTSAASMLTGPRPLGRLKVAAGTVTEIRMIEPGSGYLKGSIATIASSNVINTSDTNNMIDSQPVEFVGLDANGLTANTTYFVIGSTIVTNTSFKVSATAGSATAVTITAGTGLSGTFRTGPIVTQTDPNKVKTAATRVRMGDGALGNPSFGNRGTGNITASTAVSGDGYSDVYQNSTFINVLGLFASPTPGSNIQFATISNTWYKLVSVSNLLGTAGNYTATFQINPSLTTKNAPADSVSVTTRLKYSQVRLTGHDFLYIGTGNQATTNYPYVDPTLAIQTNQTAAFAGGRVFFTSTDQDGNFNVGNLFGVQQATGTATLNATAFNLAGLQSLQLGAVTLGVGSAIINQFSTDPYFTANSDSILPTQKAVKAYITSQIGGGSSSLNVNTLTSGVISIFGNTITTSTGVQINITSKMNFTGGIDGSPVALAYFTQK
jgi:hypothetical protein